MEKKRLSGQRALSDELLQLAHARFARKLSPGARRARDHCPQRRLWTAFDQVAMVPRIVEANETARWAVAKARDVAVAAPFPHCLDVNAGRVSRGFHRHPITINDLH